MERKDDKKLKGNETEIINGGTCLYGCGFFSFTAIIITIVICKTILRALQIEG